MGGMSLPFPGSNNAPLPIPGGYGNPTGANFGAFGSSTGQPFPTMPAFGGPGGGPMLPGATGPSYNVGPWGTGGGLADLNAGITSYGDPSGKKLYNELGQAYGKGLGSTIGDLLSGKLFNPQVAAAFLNAQQPGIARGEAGILSAFGDAGARFGSSAAIGMGDYESQVQLNQQQTLASMFENAQSEELNLLGAVMPTLHQERADSSGGFMHYFGQLSKLMAGITNLGTPFSVDNPPAMPGASPKPTGGGAPSDPSTIGTGTTVGSDAGTMNAPLAGATEASQSASAAGALGGAGDLFGGAGASGGMDMSMIAALFA